VTPDRTPSASRLAAATAVADWADRRTRAVDIPAPFDGELGDETPARVVPGRLVTHHTPEERGLRTPPDLEAAWLALREAS
jgi:hypothetical protein